MNMEFADHIPTPKVEGVWYYDGRQKAVCGTLCLTGHHMIFYADEMSSGEIWILYKNIDAIEKRIGMDKGTLILKCKDLKQIQITIPGVDDASNISSTAEVLSSITEPTLLYPYFYRPKFKFDEDGWNVDRLGEHFTVLSSKTDRWRISDVNADFGLCSSYPRHVIVPSSIDDATIRRSSKFRQGGRFPILSYFHKNGASILRSSQPLVGTGNRRCKDDERLINAMLGYSHRGYVLDVRSVNAASQAKTKGGGFETEHHYPRWKRIHMNLHSYFVQQESLIRIVEASNDKSGSMDRWMSKLESSNWMEYIKKALEASCLLAQCIDREEWSVLVHGAEGVDSTLTVTSLAQIILDAECRTIRGFFALIDREWIYGGHPFADRSAHAAYSNGKQRSEGPVFAIFLECVYQLLCQFPLSFEYTSTLLVDLRMHSYASPFGTFLYNNMQERLRGKVSVKTVSLWTYLLSPSMYPNYVNPLYRKKSDVIWPSVAPPSLDFWEELFTPWSASHRVIWHRVFGLETEREELKRLVTRLSKRVEQIEIRESHAPGLPEINTHGLVDLPADQCDATERLSPSERRVEHHHSRVPVRKRSDATSPFQPTEETVPNGIEQGAESSVPLDATSFVADVSQNFVEVQPNLLDDLLTFENEDSTPALGDKRPCDAVCDAEGNEPVLDACDLIDLKDIGRSVVSNTSTTKKEVAKEVLSR